MVHLYVSCWHIWRIMGPRLTLPCTLVVQAAGYYLGMLAYFWVLATPAFGFFFGARGGVGL